jgi:hypothetical protein
MKTVKCKFCGFESTPMTSGVWTATLHKPSCKGGQPRAKAEAEDAVSETKKTVDSCPRCCAELTPDNYKGGCNYCGARVCVKCSFIRKNDRPPNRSCIGKHMNGGSRSLRRIL